MLIILDCAGSCTFFVIDKSHLNSLFANRKVYLEVTIVVGIFDDLPASALPLISQCTYPFFLIQHITCVLIVCILTSEMF